MKKWLMAVVFGSVLVLGACGGGGDEGADDGGNGGETASSGEEIYQNNCSACHGDDLSGNSGPDLTDVGSNYSADEIVNIIHEGKGGMPAQTQVSDEDAETLANWLVEQ
ncbi:MAG TPA: cytochrome c [Candidatus Avamphibacillus sp.]|nr:cytochrome c [Candidatus Avamphibacillus sp.]